MVPETIRHFIGGHEARSSYAKTFGAPDPATGQQYTRVEMGVDADISQAVLAAQAALAEGPWVGLPSVQRADILQRIADAIESQADQIADFEVLGTGLPVTQARGQVARAANCFGRAARVIAAGEDPPVLPAPSRYTSRRPAGVAGIITSWRAPFLAQARALAPALAAGCTVVLQADAWAPLSAALLPEITTTAGLPSGVLNIVHGTGNWRGDGGTARTEARDALVTHPDVPLLSFAGDGAAGERAARDAATHHKRLIADLAANSPCLIFQDADPGRAVAHALYGAVALNGGRRTATSRIFVERRVYEAVLARLAEVADGMRVGPPADTATKVGPLVHAEHHDRVMSSVRRGIRDGARLAAGGRRPVGLTAGNYLATTVLADVTPKMQIFTEVLSAPVMCVTPFDTEEEAAALASGLPDVPAAYLWTRDTQRAVRLAEAIRAPMTWVNSHNPDDRDGTEDDEIDRYTRPGSIDFAAADGPGPSFDA